MGQKVNPKSFRLGVTIPWQSRWFFKKSIKFFLEEDCLIREIIKEKAKGSGIAAISIERTAGTIRTNIRSSRPGLIIGRGGKGIDDLKNAILKKMKILRKNKGFSGSFSLNVNIEEMKRTDVSAAVIAEQIAGDIERRMPYRLIMKRQLELLKQKREILGVKIKVGGRLNGAEISRREHLGFGRMPAQTLRSDIDYGVQTARTTYGAIGVKVWVYKGEIFEEKER